MKKTRGGLQSLWFALTLALLSMAGFIPAIKAQTDYQWTIFAGTDGGTGYADGAGSAARFHHPRGGVAIDTLGNLYVTDTSNSLIRKITPGGVVSTLAGKVGVSGSSDGPRSEASFMGPHGITVDRDGNVYVSDVSNHTIRKITPSGEVSTLAGRPGNTGSADGTGSDARFYYPEGLAIDSHGNLFVADSSNHTIRKITPAGVVSTFAGSPSVSTGIDGTGTNAGFYYPNGLAIDSGDNLYVADGADATVRKITPSGVVSTVAGAHRSIGYVEGIGSAARFNNPHAIAVDGDGNLFVTDISNGVIRKITPSGATSTLAKNLEGATGTPIFYDAEGIAIDSSGNLYVAAWSENVIYKITPTGVGNTLAGKNSVTGSFDGQGNIALFSNPTALAIDSTGNIYVTDTNNHTIRKIIIPPVYVRTFAGAAGVKGSYDGLSTAARFNLPNGIAVDLSGNIYVTDTGNHTIRKLTPAGTASTLAGTPGSAGITDGAGATAQFRNPQALAVDGNGNVYVADTGNHTIRKITPSGMASTWAGSPGVSGSADGDRSVARFNAPQGIYIDASGNVIVADTGNHTIRRITPTGVVSTFVGSAGSINNVDGTGNVARFNAPQGLFMDGLGNLYVADRGNNRIRIVSPAGDVSTVIGHYGTPLFVYRPVGIVIDRDDNIYISESGNNRVIVGTLLIGKPAVTAVTTMGATWQSATLSGAINPRSNETTAWIEYGLTPTYGSTASLPLTPSNGQEPQTVSATLTNLLSGVTYYYRFVATNNLGQSASLGSLFTTDPAVIVTTFAGSPGTYGQTDGTGNAARFNQPGSLAFDSNGNLYVADRGNGLIRKITPSGVVSTLIGRAGSSASIIISNLNPSAIAIDSNANIYIVSDSKIFKITSTGVVTTLAGGLFSGSKDGTGSAALFFWPLGVAVDRGGTLYVADSYNHTIRKVTSAGVVTTIAGSPGLTGSADGIGNSARFNTPVGIALDNNDNLYIADKFNNTIRKVTTTGVVTTIAGSPYSSGSIDGLGSGAYFNNPQALTLDANGNIFVSDYNNLTIRKITPDGIVSTIAGSPNEYGSNDGTGKQARFYYPKGLVFDQNTNLYIADESNNTIRKIASGKTVRVNASSTQAGALTGASIVNLNSLQTVTATPAEAYFFSNWTENGTVVSTSPNYSFTVSADRNLVANFTLKPFYQWWKTHVANGGVTDPLVSGPAATPLKDGAPNLVKYLCRIDPSAPMSESDKSALPKMTVTERESKPYLTLTHRKNQAATDLNISVQASTDLKSWQTITPDFTSTVGTDPQTGDEIIQYQVNTEDSTQKFIRLNVTSP